MELIPISSYVNTAPLSVPVSLQNASPDDVFRFEQALENPKIADTSAQTPAMPAGPIKDAISTLEKMAAKSNAVISQVLGSGSEMSTSKALAFSAALHDRALGFRVVGKLIDGTSRTIEKLTSVQ